MATAELAQAFDVRTLLDAGVEAFSAEDDWISEHKGALSASRIGGCLRREKFRLLEAPRVDRTTERQRRRMLAGKMFAELEYRKLLKAGRRPRKEVPCEIELEGMVIRGRADLVMPEGVVEIKTTERHSMHPDFLPFDNQIQLGCYQYALQKPGQLLYISGMGGEEQTFDFPSIPDIWEPHVRQVIRLFREHPGEDVLPFPCERLWCDSCPYFDLCPQESPGKEERLEPTQEQLLRQALLRYRQAKTVSASAEKAEKAAQADVLGFRPLLGQDDKGRTRYTMPGLELIIRDQSRESLDQKAARGIIEGLGKEVPLSLSVFAVINIRESE